MSLRGYLLLIRERWRVVTAGLALGVATAAAATWAVTPLYEANVTMFVSAQDMNGESDAAQAYQGSLMSQQKVKSYTRLVTSGRIREDVERRGLAPGPDSIRADVQPGTVLLTITAADPSPKRAQDLADAAAEAFSLLVAQLETPTDGGQPAVTVKVVETARLPNTPVSPRPVSNIVLGVLIGLAAGVGAALVRNTLDTSIRSVEMLQDLITAPSLGTIAFDPRAAERPVITFPHAASARAESLRRIRTNLQFVDVDHPARTIVITSSLPEEGKSTLTCDLAITLAEAGRTVVVVDADFRLPRIGDYLGLESAVGLTSVLIGHASLTEAIQPYGHRGMSVLASGPVPPNPSELLASRHVVEVLDLLADRFDVVLVDTPPLLPVTDGAILASRCDGAILVVRHAKATKQQVKESVAALEAVSARLLGTVMTMTPRARLGEGYRYHRADEPETAPIPRSPAHQEFRP
ncbi:tyrosine-protein kinase domain-containing protein [Lentzea nigeriaca]|uniref:polysaccharide biosynthesis tyrosine autokinase n=1 Tax=Lentzea nigeriaca TaxID=1128665 RepID=UPI00195C42D5|nr:polysaccharide biosynthesis tyrosine autokinase [Lentzea nigeriaca]MBM7859165.1 capsular exopolysaccharide synthesis family protein [Lentzea nigeriaca]